MTLSITDDEITSSATPHTATRCPGGWAVTWLGDRTVDHNGAITAMQLAEEVGRLALWVGDSVMIPAYAAELALDPAVAIRMVRETPAAPVLHDAHAIPANDEREPATEAEITPGDLFRDRDGDEWVAVSAGHECFLVNPAQFYGIKHVVETWGPLVKYLSDDEPISTVEPAKTHDLSVRREFGNVVVTAEVEAGNRVVYLQDGVAQDLGRVLAALTPTQREVLIDDLAGGAK